MPPVLRAGESYVQRVGADSIFHLHAHPVHALDTTPPAPMLDRRVLPQALQRKGLRRIAFAGDPSHPVQSLSRQLKAMTAPGPMMPTYEWIASSATGAETCLSANAEAYADFLKRLTWSALHDPGRTDAFAQASYLYLEDEEGTIDTLAIGAADDRGRYLRLHTTGHVFSITPAKSRSPLSHSLRPPRHAPSTLALPPSSLAMLYRNLLRHQWKGFIRNPAWSGTSVAYAIFQVLLALYFLLVLALSGAMIGHLLTSQDPAANVVRIVNQHLLSGFLLLFLGRLLFQNTPQIAMGPYLHLPIPRPALVRFFSFAALFHLHNLLPAGLLHPVLDQ